MLSVRSAATLGVCACALAGGAVATTLGKESASTGGVMSRHEEGPAVWQVLISLIPANAWIPPAEVAPELDESDVAEGISTLIDRGFIETNHAGRVRRTGAGTAWLTDPDRRIRVSLE